MKRQVARLGGGRGVGCEWVALHGDSIGGRGGAHSANVVETGLGSDGAAVAGGVGSSSLHRRTLSGSWPWRRFGVQVGGGEWED